MPKRSIGCSQTSMRCATGSTSCATHTWTSARSTGSSSRAGRSLGPAPWAGPLHLLGLAERLDFLLFLRCKLPRAFSSLDLLGLDLLADRVNHLRVRKCRDVARACEVRNSGDHAPHDLARPGFGHIGDNPDILRPRYFADQLLDLTRNLVFELLAGLLPRLERDIHLHRLAPHLIDHRHRGGFGYLLDREGCRFQFFGAQPMPGDVDHVVDASEDAEVAIFRLQRAVSGEVRPIVPVLAVLVLVVLLVVGRHETVRIAVDRLEDTGPGIADTDVAGFRTAFRDRLSLLVEDDRKDAQHPRTAAARFHRLKGGQGAAQEAAVLGLPPGIYDGGLPLPDAVVVPAPYLRLDWFADRCHVLEVVVVLLRFVRAQLAQHADGGRGRVEDVDPQPLRDPPRTAGIRVGGDALVHHAGGRQCQRTVNDVGVTGDPANVGETPVSVLRMDVLVVLRGPGDI